MKTHIFTGQTSREVLQKVKQALGDDALILSNRARDGGIEVVALAAADLSPAGAPALPLNDAVEPAPNMVPAFTRAAGRDEATAEPRRYGTGEEHAQPVRPVQIVQHFRPLEPEPQPAPPAAPAAPVASASAVDIEGILAEIQNLKTLLRREAEEKVAAAPAPEPDAARATILRELLNAGFSPQLARRMAGDASSNRIEVQTLEAVAARLAGELEIAPEDEIVNRGGVYALVGPTGVGKTTTVAKLAARAVVRYGAGSVALLTTDGYRIGAQDQLRIYARILGVPVHAVRDAEDFNAVLADLSGKHLVLIDTIGMSQRDRMVAEQTAMLASCATVKRLLLVSTIANAATLNEVVSVYKSSGVHGCILTKIDEAASLAPALDAVIRHQLPVHYVTDGQRVPEDLQLPDATALVREALRPSGDVFEYTADELGLVTAPIPTPPTPAAAAAEMTPPLPPLAVPAYAAAVPPLHVARPVQHAQVVHG